MLFLHCTQPKSIAHIWWTSRILWCIRFECIWRSSTSNSSLICRIYLLDIFQSAKHWRSLTFLDINIRRLRIYFLTRCDVDVGTLRLCRFLLGFVKDFLTVKEIILVLKVWIRHPLLIWIVRRVRSCFLVTHEHCVLGSGLLLFSLFCIAAFATFAALWWRFIGLLFCTRSDLTRFVTR